MKYFFPASVLVSLVVHGLVAVVLIDRGHVRIPNALPKLELAHVELSIAETPDETEGEVGEGRLEKGKSKSEKGKSKGCDSTVNLQPPTFNLQPPLLSPDSPVPLPSPSDTADLPKPETASEKFDVTSNASPAAKIDAPPKPRRDIKPDYPHESRRRGEQGEGLLEIAVSARGTVDDVRVIQSSGFALLDEAAVKAFRAARFDPATSGGESVSSTVRQPFKFRLQ